MSNAMPKSSTPEDAVIYATSLLKEQTIFPRTKGESRRVMEIGYEGNRCAKFMFWNDGTAYVNQDDPICMDLDESEERIAEIREAGEVGTAIWLFGPERSGNTPIILEQLANILTEGSRLIIASENPWPGKMLAKDEFAEFTDEEMTAMLVQVGFGGISEVVDGPFFRLWESQYDGPLADLKLFRADILLRAGEWQEAGTFLENVEDALGTSEAVKEFALLVAEYHTQAEQTPQAAAALSEAMQLDPKCARALCGLGRIAIVMGDVDGAADFFESALVHQPALVQALCGRAAVSEIRGDAKLAYRAMKEASDLRPFDEELMIEAIRLENAAKNDDDTARIFLPQSGVTVDNTRQV